jgi:quercetin dioxygenase-like cupin family protein
VSTHEVYEALTLHWDDQEFSEVRPGILGATRETEQLTVTAYLYQPGCAWETHQHPEDQITFVHEGGELELVVDGQPVRLRPGDLGVLPGGTPHSATVAENGRRVVTINVWRRRSPAR